MRADLLSWLKSLDWKDDETPPVVELSLYFEANTDEECIAPDQWGYGRPPIAALYARFKQIASLPNVERVLVGLHFDWTEPLSAEQFPPAENVHIFTSASESEVASWLTGLESDGAVEGWPYDQPKNAPEPSNGMKVYSVCWD